MPSFQYIQPTEEQVKTMQHYRDLYEALYKELEALPSNRGRSVAMTHLEESAMWLNKGITNNC